MNKQRPKTPRDQDLPHPDLAVLRHCHLLYPVFRHRGKINTYTWIAIGLVIGEGLVLLLFKMFCPLTVLARRYSAATAANFDNFLPNWLTQHNKVVFTTIRATFLSSLTVLISVFLAETEQEIDTASEDCILGKQIHA